MSSVPLNIGQNLAVSLIPPQQGDGRQIQSHIIKDEKLNKFVSCQGTVDDFKLLCRVLDKAVHTKWPYMVSAPFFSAPGQLCGLYTTNLS